jgi:hypothetical protein
MYWKTRFITDVLAEVTDASAYSPSHPLVVSMAGLFHHSSRPSVKRNQGVVRSRQFSNSIPMRAKARVGCAAHCRYAAALLVYPGHLRGLMAG